MEYLVIRNFKIHENDKPRLGYALRELKKVSRPSTDEVAYWVDTFAEVLSNFYGQFVRSAASKFLWMQFQSPIVIYDSIAFQWLNENAKLNSDTYADYLQVWRKEFDSRSRQIDAVCKDLVSIRRFTSAFDWNSDRQLADLVHYDWFKERVFDHAMVHSVVPEES